MLYLSKIPVTKQNKPCWHVISPERFSLFGTCCNWFVLCLNYSDTALVQQGIIYVFLKRNQSSLRDQVTLLLVWQQGPLLLMALEQSDGFDHCAIKYFMSLAKWHKTNNFGSCPAQKIWQIAYTKSPSFSAHLFSKYEVPKTEVWVCRKHCDLPARTVDEAVNWRPRPKWGSKAEGPQFSWCRHAAYLSSKFRGMKSQNTTYKLKQSARLCKRHSHQKWRLHTSLNLFWSANARDNHGGNSGHRMEISLPDWCQTTVKSKS